MPNSERFYADLVPVTRFADVSRFEDYEPVPDDWVVLVGDIAGSTEAIRDGKYKAVNMVGAAVITSVLNVCGETAVPFVFGGDGGAVVVPGSLAWAARDALGRLQAMSESWFGLKLRAAAIPVAALRAGGRDIRLLKLRLSAGNDLAMFSGDGLAYCDTWLKRATPGEPILIESDSTSAPTLDGLSCRWQPLAATRGSIATIIVAGTDSSPASERALFHRVTEGISDILGGQIAAASPVNPTSMQLRWPPAGIALEARATAGRKWLVRRYWEILLQSLIQYACEKTDGRVGYYNAPRYRQETQANTDFQKYDGMLRLVLDLTPQQTLRVERFLEDEHSSGNLHFGLHTSKSALMTCLVFSLQESRHIHFIDGGDGGYALAAAALKMQRDGIARTVSPDRSE